MSIQIKDGIASSLFGNADTSSSSTKATNDGDNNNIVNTYFKQTGGTITTSDFYGVTLKRSDGNGQAIQFANSGGALIGVGTLSDKSFVVSSGSSTGGDMFKVSPGGVATAGGVELSKTGHAHSIDQLSWDATKNLKCLAPTANGQEWSVDLPNTSYTGTYWNVFTDKGSKGTLLKVDNDSGVVSAPYGFSGSLTGNASTASKLQTARTITLAGDYSGSCTFDGSGNVTLTGYNYNCRVSKGSTNNYPYCRIAHTDGTSSYADHTVTLYLSQGYSGGKFGIIRVTLRSNNQQGTSGFASAEAKWLVRSGFALDDIVVACNDVAGAWEADVFYKANGAYAGLTVKQIDGGGRGSTSRIWTLINCTEPSDASTTTNPSTECYATITDYKTYTNILNAIDSGTVASSNVTDKLNIARRVTLSGAVTGNVDFDGTKDVTLATSLGSIDTDLTFTNNGTSFRGIQGTMADNDVWRVGGAGTSTNAGYLELATGDDSNEPIYARQYSGNFTSVTRTATILDASGNTSFPGTVTGNRFASTVGTGTSPFTVSSTTAVTNLNADMIDGVHLDNIVYGSNATATNRVTDLNAINKSGFYEINTGTNKPGTNAWYWLLNTSYSSSNLYGMQIAVGNSTSGEYFMRSRGADGSGTWHQLYSTGYKPSWDDVSGKPSSFTPSSHTHDASDLASGTVSISRIPTGSTSATVALGNHTHSGYANSSHTHDTSNIASGILNIARIPTGATSSTVALGDHAHNTIGGVTSSSALTFITSSEISSNADFYNIHSSGDMDLGVSDNLNITSKCALLDVPNIEVTGKLSAQKPINVTTGSFGGFQSTRTISSGTYVSEFATGVDGIVPTKCSAAIELRDANVNILNRLDLFDTELVLKSGDVKIPNNKAYQCFEFGGTSRNMAMINDNDDMFLAYNNSLGKLYIGANKNSGIVMKTAGTTTIESALNVNGDIVAPANASLYLGANYTLREHGNGNVSVNGNGGYLALGYNATSYVNFSAPVNGMKLLNNAYLSFTNTSGVAQWNLGLSNGNNVHMFSQNNFTGSISIGHTAAVSTWLQGSTVVLNGNSVRLTSTTGTVVTSDERLKKDMTSLSLDERYDDFFMGIDAKKFKYIDGTSDRFHIGVSAQEIEKGLAENGLTTKDFAGFVEDEYIERPLSIDEELEAEKTGKDIDARNVNTRDIGKVKGIIHTEFIGLNINATQKNRIRIVECEKNIERLSNELAAKDELILIQEERISNLEKVVDFMLAKNL